MICCNSRVAVPGVDAVFDWPRPIAILLMVS